MKRDLTDSYVCHWTSNGDYSVKSGYRCLTASDQPNDPVQMSFWNLTWHRGDLLPRIRLFVWKLSKGALPLAGIISARIKTTDPTCTVCGTDKEDVPHLLFNCPFARGCWYASPLALRSDMVWRTFAIRSSISDGTVNG